MATHALGWSRALSVRGMAWPLMPLGGQGYYQYGAWHGHSCPWVVKGIISTGHGMATHALGWSRAFIETLDENSMPK